MKLLKIIFLLSSLALVTSCAGQFNEEKSISTKQEKRKVLPKKISKAFDVLGGSVGENELNLDKLAKGDIVIEDTKKSTNSEKKFDINYVEVGNASWYGPRFHGKLTANGSTYNQHEYTAAHPNLMMPSVVRVVNLENQRSVLVVINDRGPYVKKSQNRIIDLSRKAAEDLGMMGKGVAKVRVEYLHDQTLALLSKFPDIKKKIASAKLSQALVRHVTHLNIKNGTSL